MIIRKIFLMGAIWFAFCFSSGVIAGQISEIELTDGSVISGEIISFVNETYTVNSGTLGTIKIKAAKIRSIKQNQGPKVTTTHSADTEVKGLQEKMLGNGDVLGRILLLQNDPAFQDILSDPEVMKAVRSGDIDSLLNNPKFMKVLDNSAVKDIQKEIGEK